MLQTSVTQDHPTFVTHLECSMTADRVEPDWDHCLSAAGKPLLVRYDLEAQAAVVPIAAYRRALTDGRVARGDKLFLYNCATG